MIGETVSHYRILSTLGRGGMGEVYLAHDTELDRDVAIKFLSGAIAADENALARFRREAKAAAALHHPHIITIHEIGEHQGRPFIVMEHVEGDTVDELIASGTLDTRAALTIAVEACEGLEEAHRAGIVHRDLKPANVRIDRSGRAKILDFGLARSAGATTLTAADTTLGTVRYMSPEQARGERVDARSDIFSMGAMLYEMLAGRPPFNAEHPAAIAYAIQNEQPQPLARYMRDVTPELERVIGKALAKDPGARYQTAADLAADLRQILGGSDVREVPVGKGPRRRARWIVPATAAVVVVVGAFLLQRWPGAPAEAGPNTLAIMYFENVADRDDPQRFGEIATNLLITDLSESQFVHVLSSQRLYDILRLQGKEGVRAIDRQTAGDVARHAGARQMLLGSILRTEPSMVMTSQLVDVATGEVLGSQRVTGEPGEDVFALVDRLSREVRGDLGLPTAALHEDDAPVADVTTHSEEAYRYYVVGMEAYNRWQRDQSVVAFQKAVELDSTFAMAWLALATRDHPYMETRPDSVTRYALAQAVRYSSRAGKKERRYIAARRAVTEGDIPSALAELRAVVEEYPDEKDAHYNLGLLYSHYTGELDKAIGHMRRVLEIDPLDKLAYNQLAYDYATSRDLEKAVAAVNRYVELCPNEFNPYDSRADIYAHFGLVDSARSSFEKALTINPAFYPSRLKMAGLYMLKGDRDRARQVLAPVLSATDPHARSFGRLISGVILLHEGRAREAVAELEDGMAADRRDGVDDTWTYFSKLELQAVSLFSVGEVDAGLAAFDTLESRTAAPRSVMEVHWRLFYAIELMRLGRSEQAGRELDRAEERVRTLDSQYVGEVDNARALAALSRGDTESARVWVGRSVASGTREWTEAHLCLALCNIETDPASAARELEFQCRYVGEERMIRPLLAVEVRYHLARACESLGRPDEAARRYREFLDFWSDADPDIRLTVRDPRDPDNRPLEFARARLQALGHGI